MKDTGSSDSADPVSGPRPSSDDRAQADAGGGSHAKFTTELVKDWILKCQRRDRKEVIELWGKFAKEKSFWGRT